MSRRKRIMIVTGKRKTAIARAIVRPGKGRIRINRIPLEIYGSEMVRTKIMEPVLLLKDMGVTESIDVDVSVKGGGFMGQAEAVRMALARAIVRWTKEKPKIKKILIDYDRTMLAGDPRRTESKKFGGPSARTRRQKSYR